MANDWITQRILDEHKKFSPCNGRTYFDNETWARLASAKIRTEIRHIVDDIRVGYDLIGETITLDEESRRVKMFLDKIEERFGLI